MHQALISLTAVAIIATALASPLALASPSQPAPPKVAVVIGPMPKQVEIEAAMRRISQAYQAEQFAKVMAGEAENFNGFYMTGRYTANCLQGVVHGRFHSLFPETMDPCGWRGLE